MIVVDTSAWVEFLRGTSSDAAALLREALDRDEPLAVVDVVLLELLAGAASDREVQTVARLVARARLVPAQAPADHEHAALLYREARGAGRTVRSLVDCLVAAVPLRLDAPLLARDRDDGALAEVSDLRLV